MHDTAIEGVNPIVAHLIEEARRLLPGFDAELGPDDWIDLTEGRIDDDLEIAWLPPWELRRYPGVRVDERGHIWMLGPEE